MEGNIPQLSIQDLKEKLDELNQKTIKLRGTVIGPILQVPMGMRIETSFRVRDDTDQLRVFFNGITLMEPDDEIEIIGKVTNTNSLKFEVEKIKNLRTKEIYDLTQL